jgi:hypothetical protein
MSFRTLELDFCSEPVDLYCPACGECLFVGGIKHADCPHLLFWGDSASGCWAWVDKTFAPAFNRSVEKLYHEAVGKGFYGTLENFRAGIKSAKAAALAADAANGKALFMFRLSTSDIGCGGMHNGTLYALFDYAPATGNRRCRLA